MGVDIVVLLVIGLSAGVLAGLLGIGGGLVIVPALSWLLVNNGAPLETAVPIAVATSLGTMLMTSASAIWFHDRRAGVDWPCVARLAPSVAIGALLGGWLAARLPGDKLALVFAVLAAVVGLRMMLLNRPPSPSTTAFPRAWWLAGPVIGLLSAVMGIGGGSFNVPYLARNGYPMVRAVAIASTCGWPIALGGVIGFALAPPADPLWPQTLGYFYWPGWILIGLGGVMAAPLGVALAHRLPATPLKRLFGAMLVLVAIRMIW
ncbi:MAG: sulfite exporter TauE/SafE family protein [Wenzhouxiangella sp.]